MTSLRDIMLAVADEMSATHTTGELLEYQADIQEAFRLVGEQELSYSKSERVHITTRLYPSCRNARI